MTKIMFPIWSSLGGIILGIVAICIKYFPIINEYSFLVMKVGMILLGIGIIAIGILVKKNGLKNYYNSVRDTWRLKQFMKIPRQVNVFTSKATINPKVEAYNAALRDNYIEYTDKTILVKIAIPTNVAAKQLLDQMKGQIEQQVASYSYAKNYLLSSLKNDGQYYIIEGTKK